MPSSDYYWSRTLMKGFGKMWFPTALQQASSTGGGQSLLGSVVEELHGSIAGFFHHYPAPYHMTTPRLIYKVLEGHREEIGLPADLTLKNTLAAPDRTKIIAKRGSLKGDVGHFPGVPAEFSLDVDYSRMKSVTINFGAATLMEYIPTEYLARLYRHVNGDATQVQPGLAIKVDENYIVDQVLVTSEYGVTFESDTNFDAEFKAKLEALKRFPSVGAQVKFAIENNNRVVVEIKGGPDYLIAFKVISWDDLG